MFSLLFMIALSARKTEEGDQRGERRGEERRGEEKRREERRRV